MVISYLGCYFYIFVFRFTKSSPKTAKSKICRRWPQKQGERDSTWNQPGASGTMMRSVDLAYIFLSPMAYQERRKLRIINLPKWLKQREINQCKRPAYFAGGCSTLVENVPSLDGPYRTSLVTMRLKTVIQQSHMKLIA